LIFREATKSLLDQLELVVKLIRSKGVGIFFCTQVPSDIPEEILSQLGSKFQHAMRAFTAKDRKGIKLVAQNYPSSEFYDTENLLTELGIGEALVTVLNEKGQPTPLVHTLLCAPGSRMDILTPDEQEDIVRSSSIARYYNEVIDRESAYEMLTKKLTAAASSAGPSNEKSVEAEHEEKSSGGFDFGEKIAAMSKNPLVKQVARDITRSLLGSLFGKPSRRR
jgi:DNA helicase HerA-like ATPase